MFVARLGHAQWVASLSIQLEVWYSGIMSQLVPQRRTHSPRQLVIETLIPLTLYNGLIIYSLSQCAHTCLCVSWERCAFGVSRKRGLQEVSIYPLVTLELVILYFLLLNYACTPTVPTHNVEHLISLIWPLIHNGVCPGLRHMVRCKSCVLLHQIHISNYITKVCTLPG